MSREGFGPSLRRERERRGITLDAIAETTKIKRSLLQALERGDLSQWPLGIFRRAFIRAYARAIGVPAEPLVAEFVRLFPEPGDNEAADADSDVVNLRLLMADDPHWLQPLARNAGAALVDAAIVIALGALVALAMGVSWWTAVAATALGYYAVGTVLCGRTLVLWLWSRPRGSTFAHVRRAVALRTRNVAWFGGDTDSQPRREVQPASRLLGS
jgi:transcriptional regulator with XRE-family HTH domain